MPSVHIFIPFGSQISTVFHFCSPVCGVCGFFGCFMTESTILTRKPETKMNAQTLNEDSTINNTINHMGTNII